MSVWRYKASASQPGHSGGGLRYGELAADSASDARAALRRIGLQPLEVRPAHARASEGPRPRPGASALAPLAAACRSHLRRRRGPLKAEVYDSLATMLDAGVPLLEAVGTLAGQADGDAGAPRAGRSRALLVGLHDALRSGSSLSAAMAGASAGEAWFDRCERAMVESAQVGGTLPSVLRSLADRQARAGELAHRLWAALAYPALVSLVGLGVTVFLSTKTLPDLVGILASSKVPAPRLTLWVMAAGRSVARWWWAVPLALAATVAAAPALRAAAARSGVAAPGFLRALRPAVARRIAMARLSLGLAELLRAGVPAVEALRALEPTLGGIRGASLRAVVRGAAARVERGDSLEDALSDPFWFDAEFRRMLGIGEASGELESLLERLGRRYERSARRAVDRLAATLEPAAIVALAFLVGLVVMAAVLPLIRLQEVI